MCVIYYLPAGVRIPDDKLKCAVANNPHGFGIVIRDVKNNLIEIKRKFDPESNWKDVKKILDDNIDCDRYVHHRWSTVGTKDLDNVHPFTSYWSEGRQVYFMHNGTLSDFNYARTSYQNGVELPNPYKDWSDSRKFNEQILAPLLLTVDGGKGHGDIKNEFANKVIEKFWNSSISKGILISNDQGHTLINPAKWVKVKFTQANGEVVEVLASNDEYFDNISRGPEYERRREAQLAEQRKREEEQRAKNPPVTTKAMHSTSNDNFSFRSITSKTFHKIHGVREDFEKIAGFAVKDDLKTISLLAYVTETEFENFVETRPNDAVDLLISLSSHANDAYQDLEKKDSSINELSRKVQNLRKALEAVGIDPKEVEKNGVSKAA